MTIWTVSTLSTHNREMGARTWGYFFTREDAVAAMMLSVDTECGYYTHAVIEEFEPGIYCLSNIELWYEWVIDVGWRAVEKPESELHIINYGMG
jgi:hypothetical protein